MSIDIHVDETGSNLLIYAENTTSATSALYHMVDDRERVPGQLTAHRNMYQIYMWKEPISNVYFEEALGTEYNPVKYNNLIDW
ncbi:hypothetical protein [Longitalea luteola]|uniref:hypothetical protein n=1 Tax=Longitalea luteola TaxID=2812563 RepID=UPI001A9785A6|nr:hypothetical protein [Longitalea luteola]